jgi:6-phosphogluconolactonase/glucosamine-6-phosphate isomerase/deaminase
MTICINENKEKNGLEAALKGCLFINKVISMRVRQILKSTHIINTVPDLRKASAVANSVNGKIRNACPASILQMHKSCYCFFDKNAASKLDFTIEPIPTIQPIEDKDNV